jgi:hypothetical protein
MVKVNAFMLLAMLLIAFPALSQVGDFNQADRNNQSWIFSTDNKYGNQITVLDKVDDIRNYTSQALFAESAFRLNRPLTKTELREIVQSPTEFETFNSLYFTPIKEGPTINLFYAYGNLNNGQITNYFEPNNFNDVQINKYGVALQYQYNKSNLFEKLFLRGQYARTKNHGVIEFFPDNNENINEVGINSAILFKLSNNTLTLFPNYTYLDIDQDIENPYTRRRNIFSIGFSYGTPPIFMTSTPISRGSPQPSWTLEGLVSERYDPRGKVIYGGIVYDKETFGNVDVVRQDYYLGASLAEWLLSIKNIKKFDLVIQPNFFTSKVENDSSQDNSQFRAGLSLYYEHNKNLLFTFPLRYDKAINGPDDYENWRIGAQLTKNWGNANDNNSNIKPELFLTLRYDFQRFFNLDKDLNLFLVNLVVTFR